MSAPNDQGNIQQNNRDNPIVGREQKMLDSSMENLSLRLTDLRGSLSSMITKLETDPNHNWPSFLNSLALISGQMNSLMKNIKSESTNKNPPLLYRRYITLPLFLSPDRDEELVKLTEGRVTTFSHDVVPHLLRTKPDPEVEARYASYENRTNSLGAETISKQLTVMEKITTEKLKLINRERDDMDLKANARSEMERTSSLDDTMTLVAAVAYGKGLRGIPMQTMPPGMHGGPSHGPPGMMLNRPPMGQAPTMPGKVQSTIKTNIKAGTQVHPYQRPLN